MKAVVLEQHGGPEVLVLRDLPDPQPAPGQVLVRLRAAALNHRDVWIRRGQYAAIRLPAVLGSDGAGEIASGPRQGEPVVIFPSLDWGDNPKAPGPNFRILGMPDQGTYAELIAVPETNVFPKPPHLSWEEAAAVPLAALTAYRAVVTRAQTQAGETVLVTGIGGGVALFALQIARTLGARVFVTSSSEEKLQRARSLGSEGGALYTHPEWWKGLPSPDVIIDGAGGPGFLDLIGSIKAAGRLVTYGGTAGAVPQLIVQRIFWKQLNVLGTTMGNAQEFQHMLELYNKHQLRPVIDQVFPLAQAADAHRRMDAAAQFGKIVLRIA